MDKHPERALRIEEEASGLPRLLNAKQAADYLWGRTDRSAIQRLYRMAEDLGAVRTTDQGQHWFPLSKLQRFANE